MSSSMHTATSMFTVRGNGLGSVSSSWPRPLQTCLADSGARRYFAGGFSVGVEVGRNDPQSGQFGRCQDERESPRSAQNSAVDAVIAHVGGRYDASISVVAFQQDLEYGPPLDEALRAIHVFGGVTLSALEFGRSCVPQHPHAMEKIPQGTAA